MDADVHYMQIVARTFKLLGLLTLLFGVLKAILIGLVSLSPAFLLNFMTIYEADHVYIDFGLVRQITTGDSIGSYISIPTSEKILLIALAIGSGVFFAFVLFAAGVVVDFVREVGVEILDLRRIRFEQGNPQQRRNQ